MNPTIQIANAYGFATSPIMMLRTDTNKTGIANKIITEMQNNANTYSIISPGGIVQ